MLEFERIAKGCAAALVALPALALGIPFAHASPDRSEAPIRGMVRAVHQAAITTDLSARVKQLNVRDAQSFKKGDVLVVFDCGRLDAEQAAAEAAAKEMRLTVESNEYLVSKSAAGKLDLDVSRARADKADAEARALKEHLKQCTLVAPFDGRVADLSVNEFEIPAQGKPFISLVDESRFEIDLIVPSSLLKVLEPGQKFKYHSDETGRDYDAVVLRIGAVIEPVSQTIKVIAAFADPSVKAVAGMSGSAAFELTRPSQ